MKTLFSTQIVVKKHGFYPRIQPSCSSVQLGYKDLYQSKPGLNQNRLFLPPHFLTVLSGCFNILPFWQSMVYEC
jgi:hypothetical protein